MYAPVFDTTQVARELADIAREQTDASMSTCIDTVSLILNRLIKALPGAKELAEIKAAVDADDLVDVDNCYDAQFLECLMSRLAENIADKEQQSWTLQNDEESLIEMLKRLSSILNKADPKVSLKQLGDLTFIGKLVTLYQIEQRQFVRNAVLLTLESACLISPIIVSFLMSSDLPVLLAINNTFNAPLNELELSSLKLLRTLFSTCETPPLSHYDYFDSDFLAKILLLVSEEDNGALKFLLNFNSHFNSENNRVIDLLRKSDSLAFGHLLIDAFNKQRREEDMVALKMIADIFAAQPEIVSKTFYTNDLRVLCDILSQDILDTNVSRKISLILDVYEQMLKQNAIVHDRIYSALDTLLMSKELEGTIKEKAEHLLP